AAALRFARRWSLVVELRQRIGAEVALVDDLAVRPERRVVIDRRRCRDVLHEERPLVCEQALAVARGLMRGLPRRLVVPDGKPDSLAILCGALDVVAERGELAVADVRRDEHDVVADPT